jgi:hypothetical protein
MRCEERNVMTVTPLERLLIETCIDVPTLRQTQRDLTGALTRVGVSKAAQELVASRRGRAISMVVRATRPQPTAQEIEDYAHARMAVDPIFAMRMRDEPRPTLERAFLVRFPTSRSVDSVVADDGSVRIRVIDSRRVGDVIMDSSDPGDIDTDIDIEGDIDVDVNFPDIDIDPDIDDVVDTDDNDTDIDIEMDVPNAAARGVNPRTRAGWDAYWEQRAALWAELQSQSVS